MTNRNTERHIDRQAAGKRETCWLFFKVCLFNSGEITGCRLFNIWSHLSVYNKVLQCVEFTYPLIETVACVGETVVLGAAHDDYSMWFKLLKKAEEG